MQTLASARPHRSSSPLAGALAFLEPAFRARGLRKFLAGLLAPCLGLALLADAARAQVQAQSGVVGWGMRVFNSAWNDEPFVEVAAGELHTVARRSDGSVVAWGNNFPTGAGEPEGQCKVPALPPGLSYVEVAAGGSVFGSFIGDWDYRRTLARLSDGSVVEWGGLPVGNVPALPPGSSYVEVAAGGAHDVARLSDGSVVAWGRNYEGQCNVPALPAGLVNVEVTAGNVHTVARRSDGSVVAWGANGVGQCNVPTLPPGLIYVEVDAGFEHTVARRSDGSVVAWGSNHYGQCNVPALPSGLSYVEVAAGDRHTVARRSDGSVVAWGDNSSEQCSVPAPPPGLTYAEVDAGGAHTVARLSSGLVVAWGDNSSVQCNVPALPPGLSYDEVDADGLDFTSDWPYEEHFVARRSDGSVVAWGDNRNGECNVPSLPPRMSYVDVAAGGMHNIAVRSDGSIVAWGAYLGDAPALPPGLSYVEVDAAGWDFWDTGMGLEYAVALRSDGSVVAWGSNWLGQCNVPALPPGLRYVAVDAGRGHAVALRSDGSVVTWGYNEGGHVPALPRGLRYVEVEAGDGDTVALRSDGSVVGWGVYGGTFQAPALPAGLSYVQVDTGDAGTVARCSDGSVVVFWSYDGTLQAPALPPGFSYVDVAVGNLSIVARFRADGPPPPPNLCAGSWKRIGDPCRGAAVLEGFNCLEAGGEVRFEVTGGAAHAGTPGILVVSTVNPRASIQGCPVYVDLLNPLTILPHTLDGSGFFRVTKRMPPVLSAPEYFLQAIYHPSSGGLSFTNGIRGRRSP